MKSLRLFVLLVGLSGLAPAADFTGDVTAVRTIRQMDSHPGSSELWEPYLVQCRGKHLVAAFGVKIPGKTDMGDIVACVSSDDGGRSWIPVELSMDYTGPLICVAGPYAFTEKGQTRYLFPVHRNTRRNDPLGSRDHFVLSSTSLLEWNLAAFVPQPVTGPKIFLHEGNIAPGDAAGKIKMVMRTADYEDERKMTDPPRAFSTVSKDGGRTWSPAQQGPDLWNAKSKAFFGRTSGGTHVYVYNDGPATPAPTGRMALRYKLKPGGGAWGAEKNFLRSRQQKLLSHADRSCARRLPRRVGQRHDDPFAHPYSVWEVPRRRKTCDSTQLHEPKRHCPALDWSRSVGRRNRFARCPRARVSNRGFHAAHGPRHTVLHAVARRAHPGRSSPRGRDHARY